MSQFTSLGDDNPDMKKGLNLFITMIIGGFLIWNIYNIPQNQTFAIAYIILLFLYFIAVLFDLIFKKVEFFDTIVAQEPASFMRWIPKNGILLISLFFVFFSAWSVFGKTGFQVVAPPTFAVVNFAGNPLYIALLSGIAGIVENRFFFGFVFPTSYTNYNRKIGVSPLALFLSILTASAIFSVYHYAVYGLSDITATVSTFIFSMINCIIIYALRDLSASDSWHFFNNFFIKLNQLVKFV